MTVFIKRGISGLKRENEVWYHLIFHQGDEVVKKNNIVLTQVKEFWDCPECGHSNLNREFVLMEKHVDPEHYTSLHSYRHVQSSSLTCDCGLTYIRESGPSGGPRMTYRMEGTAPMSRADLLLVT